MAMETEQDRLQRLYQELGDEHLLDLAEDQEDLTDEARLALGTELRRRGIVPDAAAVAAPGSTVEPTLVAMRETGFESGVPGILPGGAAAMEQALDDSGGEEKDGMRRLIAFYDGLELAKAMAVLDEAEMDPVVEAVASDGAPAHYEIWVETADLTQAQALLRQRMGLFPLAEVDEDGAIEDGADEGDPMGRVAQFDTEVEAERVRAMLADHGFAAETERDEDEESGKAYWSVTVEPEEHTRAVELVAGELGLA
jgi:hypothetical protein